MYKTLVYTLVNGNI